MTNEVITETEAEKEKRTKALAKAYGNATALLRSKHQDEFNGLYTAEAKKLGYDWEPKKSAEDRAAEQVAALLEKFPNLADRLAPAAATPVEKEPLVEQEPLTAAERLGLVK